METNPETPAVAPSAWSPLLGESFPVGEADVRRLAETFAATPEAVRQAVERVGPDFRDLQRELGGRR